MLHRHRSSQGLRLPRYKTHLAGKCQDRTQGSQFDDASCHSCSLNSTGQGSASLFHVEHFTLTYCLTFRPVLVEFVHDEKAILVHACTLNFDWFDEFVRLHADK